MDYMDEKIIKFYQSSNEFFKSKKNQRVISNDNKVIQIRIPLLNLKEMIHYYLVEKVLVFQKMFIIS